MKLLALIAALVAALIFVPASEMLAHPDKKEKRPQTVADAVVPMTPKEWRNELKFRHPPGNVRAEDMAELFGNRVMVIDRRRKNNSDGSMPLHALKVVFMGRDGRYAWCAYDKDYNYFFADHVWAPVKVKHDGRIWPRLDGNINNDNHNGMGPLYDGTTGRTIMYARAGRHKTWITWDVGHLQERLPRAVYTICPDFPPADELGVGINEKQTAVTYDALIAQDPGRRVLRPDLITPDPTEPAQ